MFSQFQQYFHINPIDDDNWNDAATIDMMNRPRCGVQDLENFAKDGN